MKRGLHLKIKQNREDKHNLEQGTVRIYNLSSHSLTPSELILLKKVLSFSPSIGPNKFGLFKDLNTFIHLLTHKRHYSNNNCNKNKMYSSQILRHEQFRESPFSI